MPTITHAQAIAAHKALLEIAKLDNIPAIPTGMAIRRGVKALGEICDLVEETRKDMAERHIKRDDAGNKVVAETGPDGKATAWAIDDPEAYSKEHNELYAAEVDVPWALPESFLAGSSPKPMLLIALGDLLTEDGKGA